MENLENIEDIEMTTAEVIDSWPVIEEIDLGFSEPMEPSEGEEPGARYLNIRLHHHPLGDPDDITLTSYSVQPGVIEQIIAGVCAANTMNQDDAEDLFGIIQSAVQFYREGHTMREQKEETDETQDPH